MSWEDHRKMFQDKPKFKRKVTLVIAGSIREFIGLAMDMMHLQNKLVKRLSDSKFLCDGTEYIYMNRPRYMRGFRNVEVLFYGNWLDLPRQDIEEFEIMAKIARGA